MQVPKLKSRGTLGLPSKTYSISNIISLPIHKYGNGNQRCIPFH